MCVKELSYHRTRLSLSLSCNKRGTRRTPHPLAGTQEHSAGKVSGAAHHRALLPCDAHKESVLSWKTEHTKMWHINCRHLYMYTTVQPRRNRPVFHLNTVHLHEDSLLIRIDLIILTKASSQLSTIRITYVLTLYIAPHEWSAANPSHERRMQLDSSPLLLEPVASLPAKYAGGIL